MGRRVDTRETSTFCRAEKETGRKLSDLISEAQLRIQVGKNNLKTAMERLSWTCTLKVNSTFLSYLEKVFLDQLQLWLASAPTGGSLDVWWTHLKSSNCALTENPSADLVNARLRC